MKKLLFPILGLLLWGCASDDITTGNEGNNQGVVRNYLSVNIMAPGGQNTRADEGKYQDGAGYEGYVESIRFYFFDDANQPVIVDDGGKSYIDWSYSDEYGDEANAGEPNRPTQDEQDNTIEKVLKTTLQINTPEGTSLPTKVLAVVNPRTMKEGNLTLADLKTTIIEDFKDGVKDLNPAEDTDESDNNKGNFVMSNSVYAINSETTGLENAQTATIDAAIITPANYSTTEEKAKETDPVVIYVERVLARLDLKIGIENAVTLDDESTGYLVFSSDTDKPLNGTVDETPAEEIYVKFLGWNVTSTPTKSYLVKNVNDTWQSKALFGIDNEPWSNAAYHRSFWAINPTLVYPKDGYQHGAFESTADGDISNAQHFTVPTAGNVSTVYIQENAALSAAEAKTANPTKVIIAAQLVKKDGTPVEIAQWANVKYTLAGVKEAIANALDLYYQTEEDGKEKWVKITSEDLDFAVENSEPTPGNLNYFVNAVLSQVGKGKTWNVVDAAGNRSAAPSDINAHIKSKVNHVMVWKEGYTYYYFDVQHLGINDKGVTYPATYGIVRNHIYDATVKSVAGLGTPVYNPGFVIYPERPQDEGTLSVEVRVLKWRVVSHDYELDWK